MLAVSVENGSVVIGQRPAPAAPLGEVVIATRIAGICATDLEIVRGYGHFAGVIGHEFIGTVTTPGRALSGKRVVGDINCVCGRCDMCGSGLSSHCRQRTVLGIAGRDGALAEAFTLPERNCHEVPDGLPDEEAVFAEPLAAAIQVTRQVKLDARTNVAVLGTGRLGILVCQVLARTGCKLLAIGRNRRTLDLLDRKAIRVAAPGEVEQRGTFDVVVDCTGSPDGLAQAAALVRPRGTIVLKTTCHERPAVDLSVIVVNELTVLGSRCGSIPEALRALARREVDVTGMVTRTFELAETAAALEAAASPEHIKVLVRVAGR
jgi:threonine dehydrogenase-like Zn-dependent dehydrogenase